MSQLPTASAPLAWVLVTLGSTSLCFVKMPYLIMMIRMDMSESIVALTSDTLLYGMMCFFYFLHSFDIFLAQENRYHTFFAVVMQRNSPYSHSAALNLKRVL